jgi:hypothetical protein
VLRFDAHYGYSLALYKLWLIIYGGQFYGDRSAMLYMVTPQRKSETVRLREVKICPITVHLRYRGRLALHAPRKHEQKFP